jgi:hypothetical protein
VGERGDQVRGLPLLVLRAADRLAVDGDLQPAACQRSPGVHPGAEDPVEHIWADQDERTPESGLIRRAAGRPEPRQHLRAGIGGPLADRGERPRPAVTAAIPTASSPASGCRRPRLLRGSGTWARRSRRHWLHAAAVMGEDGRASLGADDGERENFHRSARTPPATRGHAGHITPNHDTAGHTLTSRLCRVPAGPADLGRNHDKYLTYADREEAGGAASA